jgi:hypothetical protein
MKFTEEQRKELIEAIWDLPYDMNGKNEVVDYIESLLTVPAESGKRDRDGWEIVQGVIGKCTCDIAYVSRRMTDPNCKWCDLHVDLINAFNGFAASETAWLRAELEEQNITHLQVCDNLRKSEIKRITVIQELGKANDTITELIRQTASLRPAPISEESEQSKPSRIVLPEKRGGNDPDYGQREWNWCIEKTKELNPTARFVSGGDKTEAK